MREELRTLKEELSKHLRVDGSVNIAGDLRPASPMPKADNILPVAAAGAEPTEAASQPQAFDDNGVFDGETQPPLMFDEAEPIDDESEPGAPTPLDDNGHAENRAGATDEAPTQKDMTAQDDGHAGSEPVAPKEKPVTRAAQPVAVPKQGPPIHAAQPAFPKPSTAIPQDTSVPVQKGQSRLLDFEATPAQEHMDDGKPRVIVDTREFNSRVVVELSNLGIIVESAQLEVGDYVVSDRCAIERKDVEDFLASLIDKRLFAQAKRLVSVYPRPLMILEGEDLFLRRRISPEAIMGALSSLTVNFKLPIITTRDPKETAMFIAVLAKKEQQEGNPVGKRGQKGHRAIKDK